LSTKKDSNSSSDKVYHDPLEEKTPTDTSTEENSQSRLADFKEHSKKYLWNIGKALLPFASLFLLLEIAMLIVHAVNPDISDNLFPIPHELVAYAWRAFFPGKDSFEPSVALHIGRSFARVAIGFAIGVVSGILIGILMGISKWFYRLLNPLFSLMISIPTLAWVPILLTIFGLNPTTIVITVFLGCFFPIVYSTTNGIRSIDKKLIWAARIMGANKFEIFFDVLLPGSLVSIIAGLRLAIGYSWRAIVGAEMLVALTDVKGIGYYIIGGKVANQTAQILVGIFLIALCGLLLDAVLMKPLEYFTLRRWGMVEKTEG